MNRQILRWVIPYVLLFIPLSACTPLAVPQSGTGTVTIVEGGLVETMVFERGATLNIQITRDHVPESDYYVQPVLIIGRFSPLIGSGFTKRSNIYYEAEIESYGQDAFEAGGEEYHVLWRQIEVIPGPEHSVSVFSVTLEQAQQ